MHKRSIFQQYLLNASTPLPISLEGGTVALLAIQDSVRIGNAPDELLIPAGSNGQWFLLPASTATGAIVPPPMVIPAGGDRLFACADSATAILFVWEVF